MSRPRTQRLDVVVVEANKTQSQLLKRVLEADGDIAVVATASTADQAADTVLKTRPKVVTLDLQIEGGGIEAIVRIMAKTPRPILVLSAAVQGAWSRRAVDALAAGAADVLPKPVRWDRQAESELRDRVRAMAGVRVQAPPVPVEPQAPVRRKPAEPPAQAVAIAASTGGPAALAHILGALTGVDVPVLLVQHLHPEFMTGFVQWLGRLSALPVKQGRGGERVHGGTVYVAPARSHMRLHAGGILALDQAPARLHQPSADELFSSVARELGTCAVGVLLTGMGNDGAQGLLDIKQAGGTTIVQDESTSAVFGMPAAAIRKGAAMHTVRLNDIPDAIRTALRAAARKAQ